MKNVVFVRFSEQLAAAADPVSLLLRTFNLYRSPAGSSAGASSRAALPRVQQLCRVLPVQTTCHANLPALTAALERLFDRLAVLSDEQILNPPLAFPLGDQKKEEPSAQASSFRGPLTYLVLFEARNHSAFASTPKPPRSQTSASSVAPNETATNNEAATAATGESSSSPTPIPTASETDDQKESASANQTEDKVDGESTDVAPPSRRQVTGLLRDDVLATVVQVVRARRPGWRVSLERPALAIGVQVLGASACIGLLPRYHSLSKYNVAQLQRLMLDVKASA